MIHGNNGGIMQEPDIKSTTRKESRVVQAVRASTKWTQSQRVLALFHPRLLRVGSLPPDAHTRLHICLLPSAACKPVNVQCKRFVVSSSATSQIARLH